MSQSKRKRGKNPPTHLKSALLSHPTKAKGGMNAVAQQKTQSTSASGADPAASRCHKETRKQISGAVKAKRAKTQSSPGRAQQDTPRAPSDDKDVGHAVVTRSSEERVESTPTNGSLEETVVGRPGTTAAADSCQESSQPTISSMNTSWVRRLSQQTQHDGKQASRDGESTQPAAPTSTPEYHGARAPQCVRVNDTAPKPTTSSCITTTPHTAPKSLASSSPQPSFQHAASKATASTVGSQKPNTRIVAAKVSRQQPEPCAVNIETLGSHASGEISKGARSVTNRTLVAHKRVAGGEALLQPSQGYKDKRSTPPAHQQTQSPVGGKKTASSELANDGLMMKGTGGSNAPFELLDSSDEEDAATSAPRAPEEGAVRMIAARTTVNDQEMLEIAEQQQHHPTPTPGAVTGTGTTHGFVRASAVAAKTADGNNTMLNAHPPKTYKDVSKEYSGSKLAYQGAIEATKGHTSSSSSKNISITAEHLRVSHWLKKPLLRAICNNLEKKEIELFEWQAECLALAFENPGDNIVFSAPTSAGKSLVSEIIAFNKLADAPDKKVLLLYPYVSIAAEKEEYLTKLVSGTGLRVAAFTGAKSHAQFEETDIGICTYEKANGMINRYLKEDQLEKIGLVVVDEVHMIGDESRGGIIELLLIKLIADKCNIRIVAMSATVPNITDITEWLKAKWYHTNFRPVPLNYLLCKKEVLFRPEVRGDTVSFTELRRVEIKKTDKNQPDSTVSELCRKPIEEGGSVLIFAPTQGRCEILAQQIGKYLHLEEVAEDTGARQKLAGQLNIESMATSKACTKTVKTLKRCVNQGVAWHHAGLTHEHRELLENAFRDGTLKVLVSTSTLSAGVNLPASRVIIRTPEQYRGRGRNNMMSTSTFMQMLGRAGRFGVSTNGTFFGSGNDRML